MFGTLGGPEIFLILVVALIVFGPRRLPEIGKSGYRRKILCCELPCTYGVSASVGRKIVILEAN